MDELVSVQIAPWGYAPTEPVRLVAQDTNDNEDLERLNFDRLFDAVEHFARFHVGPLEATRVAIVDACQRVVIGYQHDNGRLHWWGTEIGFDILERFCDRASVVMWAATAIGDLNRPVMEVLR